MVGITMVKALLVCVAVLIGVIVAGIAAMLPSRPKVTWASRVRSGAIAFAVTLPMVLTSMSAIGLL